MNQRLTLSVLRCRARRGGAAVALLLIAAMSSACATGGNTPASPEAFTAVHADSPIVADGELNEAVWREAPAYPLRLDAASRRVRPGYDGVPGRVRFAWDERHLYVAASLEDRDIVATAPEDQTQHFRYGDVLEVFLKPDDQFAYWEMYVTPTGHKTVYRIAAAGRVGLEETMKDDIIPFTQVGARVDGTLNDLTDRDERWTAEMTIPLAALGADAGFGPGEAWSILVARYNYSAYIADRSAELTTAPPLPKADFHQVWAYAPLRFAPAE